MQISTVFYLHLNQPYPILPKNTPLHPLNILPLSWYCLSATQFIQLPLPRFFFSSVVKTWLFREPAPHLPLPSPSQAPIGHPHAATEL